MTRSGTATTKMGKQVGVQRKPSGFRLPDGSRSVSSPWVWRAFFFMSLIAFGLVINFALGGLMLYAAAWLVITLGWFAISMWLWRRHVREDDLAWQARQRQERAG